MIINGHEVTFRLDGSPMGCSKCARFIYQSGPIESWPECTPLDEALDQWWCGCYEGDTMGTRDEALRDAKLAIGKVMLDLIANTPHADLPDAIKRLCGMEQ